MVSIHILLVMACPAIIIADRPIPVADIDIGVTTEQRGIDIAGRMARFAIRTARSCNSMRIAVALEALPGYILSVQRFFDRVVSRSGIMTVMTIFHCYIVH